MQVFSRLKKEPQTIKKKIFIFTDTIHARVLLT